MKVSELIKALSEYPQETEVDFFFNPCRNSVDVYDVSCDFEIHGDNETSPTILVTPKDKPNEDFETVEELLGENPKEIKIEISRDGMYFYSDGQLRREMDFTDNLSSLDERSEDVIKKLIREL